MRASGEARGSEGGRLARVQACACQGPRVTLATGRGRLERARVCSACRVRDLLGARARGRQGAGSARGRRRGAGPVCGQVGASTTSFPPGRVCACACAALPPAESALLPRSRRSAFSLRAAHSEKVQPLPPPSLSPPAVFPSPSPRAATPDRRLCPLLSRLRPFPPFAPPAAGAWLRRGVAKMEVPRLDHALSSPSSPCEEIKNLSLEAIQLCDRDGEAR